MKINYTNERNIQMLIFLLKENNIKKVIVNPGTMNMSFVISIQNDPFFELYSCVDERSACYMACGLSVESGEPVVLTCTGATASRNYMPGLTEAYYRKIPILAITSTPHIGNIGQNIPQVIDRSVQPNDVVKLSVQIPSIYCKEDEWNCNTLLNKALLELKHRGGGPVHINIETTLTKEFNIAELPKFRKITRIEYNDSMPIISAEYKNIAIFVGNHKTWDKKLEYAVEEFCQKYNAVVICDHTSNYHGKYKILANLICEQENYSSSLKKVDLLIHIGDISGAYMDIQPQKVWRVNPDGEVRDTFKKLNYIFEMKEIDFFNEYNKMQESIGDTVLYDEWAKEREELTKILEEKELPFSNIWIAQNTLNQIPNNSVLHLAILNSLRSWNYFDTKESVNIYSNTGGFGIDGILSTLIGASFYNQNKTYFGVVGDLAFFYDLNSLGNRHIGNNIRIMLINNGCGTEFHNYSHPVRVVGNEMISKFVGADGHFGNKSVKLVKNLAESLEFEYISASNKEEFNNNIKYFVDEKKHSKPLIFEIFTNSEEESEALSDIRKLKYSLKSSTEATLKKVLPPQAKNKIKKMLGR